MANLYSKGTGGNWSTSGTFNTASNGSGSDQIPTNADDVIIQEDDVVTLDATTCVAKSVTLNVRTTGTTGGKLLPSTTAHSKLVVEQGINSTGSATAAYSSHFLFDMSAAASYNCEIVLNNARQTTDSIITTQATTHGLWLNGNFTLKAAAKTRHTTLSSALSVGASSCSVPDVTGWIVGDAIIFAMTDGVGATSAPHTDIVEISSITGAGPYTVNFSATPDTTKNPGAVATCAYAHASGSPVGNLSGNLIIRPGTAGDKTYVHCRADTANQNADSYVTDVEFRSMAVPAVFVFGCLSSYGASAYLKSVSNNSFYNFTTTSSYTALSIYTGGSPGIKAAFTRQNNIFYAATGVSSNPTIYTVGNVSPIGPDEDYVIFSGGTGVTVAMPGQHQVNPKISGLRRGTAYSADAAIVVNISGITITNPQIWSCYGAAIGGTQPCTIEDGSIGSGTFSGCNNAAGIVAYAGTTVATDFTTQSANTVKDMNPAYSKSGFVQFVNKDDDLAVQEIYSYHSNTTPAIQKDVSIYNRSTSSICMTCNHADAITTSFSVLAKAGETIKVIGWVRKSSSPAYGASTLPSITISGLGITPVVATMAGGTAADAWEELTLTATNPSSTNDGNFTITLTAQSATAGAKAYFSGVPNSPFVTRCRHYGHLFQETSPTREVDDLSSANFATADGYTGFSITWGASTSPITLSASHTFQELFDYHQAKACQNVDKVLALTGAGVAGSPSLFTANDSDVTITTGNTLSGSGSLTIGGTSTLTTEFAGGSAYTYTDGTWSQATTIPAFSGGQLNIGAAGTYTYVQAAGMILSMTPTAPGTYALGATTFTGQVDLRNTSGTHAITVELPSGTSYTTANNTGAAITVSLPVVTADVSITGMPTATGASTRLQIINSTAEGAVAWQANTVYATGAIVKRPAGLGSEQTAGLYFRATTGGTSHATLEPTWNTTVGGTTTDGTVTWTTYAVLFYDADPVTGSYVTTYIDGKQFLVGESVKIRFAEMDAGTSFKRYSTTLVAATTGFSTVVDEVADEVYATNGLNGSSYEGTYSPDFTHDYIVLDTNTDYSGVSAYAYFCYILTTSNGMYEFWGGVTAIDVGNYRIESDILNLFFDETNGFVKPTDTSRIFRKDGTRPALDPTTGGHGLEINWRVPVSVVSTGGSALTPTESAYLLALPSASSNASSVMSHADMVKLIKRGLNKFVLNPADGTVKVYDNDGTTLLYSGIAYSDAAGTILYDGTAAVHHTTRLT